MIPSVAMARIPQGNLNQEFSRSLILCRICVFRLVPQGKQRKTDGVYFHILPPLPSQGPSTPQAILPTCGLHPGAHDWNLLQRGPSVKSLTSCASLPGFRSMGMKYLHTFKAFGSMPHAHNELINNYTCKSCSTPGQIKPPKAVPIIVHLSGVLIFPPESHFFSFLFSSSFQLHRWAVPRRHSSCRAPSFSR